MEINCSCEFGYELQLVIPYAYFLHINKLLNKTTSSLYTKELYYFSNNHHEKYTQRKCNTPDVPNKTPHVKELNYTQYSPPPYKQIFKNDYFVYDKPLLIIHNKFNQEWGNAPINFIDKKTLNEIFNYCNNKYTIIYLRPQKNNIVEDNSNIYDLDEYDLLDLYNIINGNKLYEKVKYEYKINNFNHFQLLIHANCNKFISVQGGNCVLASYFGGTNIIYAKAGSEIKSESYNGHYLKYSECNVLQTNNYTDLLELIKANY